MPTDPILPRPYFDGKVTTIHARPRVVSSTDPKRQNSLRDRLALIVKGKLN